MTTYTDARPDVEVGTWALDRAHTTIGFLARHLMVTKVRGRFESYDASIEVAEDLADSKIEISLDAASITTGAPDRDGHLRSPDFLDVENHPVILFVSTEIAPDGDQWRVTGDLTIRDMTRPVTLAVEYEGSAVDPWGKEHVGFSARANLTREDWGLTWNAPIEGGGWLVSKDVSLDIEGQLVRP